MIYRNLKKYKYQLMHDEEFPLGVQFDFDCDNSFIQTAFIHLTKDGILEIRKGYSWDGATCFPDYKWIMTPSLVHDALCQLIRIGFLDKKYQKVAHEILRDMCRIRLKKHKFMADVVYTGVRSFSRLSSKKVSPQDIIYEVY